MVVRQIRDWRRKNGLSQRAAVEVMRSHDLEVSTSVLSKWECGERQPGKLATKALQTFLTQYPVIENPPVFKPGPKRK